MVLSFSKSGRLLLPRQQSMWQLEMGGGYTTVLQSPQRGPVVNNVSEQKKEKASSFVPLSSISIVHAFWLVTVVSDYMKSRS
jgi:hypothetical protein